MTSSGLAQWWHNLRPLRRFLRFEYLGFSLTLTLFGVSTIPLRVSIVQLFCLMVVALAFHIFMCLVNDIIDLPLDRTHPGRADYPLVRGTIKLWQAIALAVLQIPLMFAITYWQGNRLEAYLTLTVGMICMTIYNLWGKRTPFPILTDIVQGIAFACVCLYGAVIFQSPTTLSWIIFGIALLWMVVVNFLGGLRDLLSDYGFGVRTTPIQLGVRPGKANGLNIPRRAKVYIWAWSALLFALMGLALIRNDLEYNSTQLWVTSAAVICLTVWCGWLLHGLLVAASDLKVLVGRGQLQLISSGIAVIVLVLARIDWQLQILLFAIVLIPALHYQPGQDAALTVNLERAQAKSGKSKVQGRRRKLRGQS